MSQPAPRSRDIRPRDIRPRVIGALRLREVQLALTLMVALVLVALSVVSANVWDQPWPWIVAIGMAAATALAVASPSAGVQMRIIVPALDLLALTALIADPQAPRIVALLAVMPAFWLGVTVRSRGIGIVAIAGAALLVLMALRIPQSTGVTLTANVVGVVIVPLALVATAWFAYSYARTIERQQLSILQRERAMQAIAKQREADAGLLDAIFETARVGLLLLDADGSVLRVNSTLRGHEALAGDGIDAMLDGARFLELDTRRELPPADAPFLRAARGEAFDNVVCWVARPGQEMFAITMSSRPLFIDEEFRGSIASVDDVTVYMRMLEDRDDFVALVSHELRTPLTSIAGFLELALDEELPDSLRSWLSIVQRNADRLRALVEDLLIVGEMSRGEVHLQARPTELRSLAEEAVATLDHRARRRGVALRLVDGPPVQLEADARRITQVIENLVSNGIKYTREHGRVDVHVELEGTDAVVRVVDDGPGVQGAGLGLWICRMIVHAHGGTLDFTSEPGTGSTASFRVPGAA